jgi:glycosyltransferase involved in cell wall biosynthesis
MDQLNVTEKADDDGAGESRLTNGPRLKISVVMTTYNGAKYVSDQLKSMAAQTRPPDEIVIGDDRSSDATMAIVERFAEESGLTVKAQVNPTRLGTTRNFERAISRCVGDIVVFSDQDDIWREDRLEKTEAVFLANPNAPYVFSNGSLIDAAGAPMEGSMWKCAGFVESERDAYGSGGGFDILCRHNVVTGAALAVRRDALRLTTPFETAFVHDHWIAMVLEGVAPGVLIDEPLIAYRLHAAQQTGFGKVDLRTLLTELPARGVAYYALEAEKARAVLARFEELGVGQAVSTQLKRRIAFSERRARMRAEPWLALPWILNSWRAGDYRLYTLRLRLGKLAIPVGLPLDIAATAGSICFGWLKTKRSSVAAG